MIDLSRLNGWVDVSHFHMETTQTILQSLRVGDWMVSLDLQDAYLQVPVHPSSRRYLRFRVGEMVYQFRALYFGLSTAPQAFTRVIVPVSSIMHRHRFRILWYLNDWLVLASTFQEIVRERDFLLWLCRQLGIHVNLTKSSLDPSQTRDNNNYFSFKGFPDPHEDPEVVSSASGVSLQPPTSSVSLASSPRSDVIYVGASSGGSASYEVPPASPQRSRFSPGRGSRFLGQLLPAGSSVVVQRVSPAGRSSSRRGSPRPLLVFGRLRHQFGGLRSANSGSWSPLCSQFSVNHRELLAVLYAVRGFLPSLRGRVMAVYSNNITALVYLRKQGGTRSSTLNAVAQSLLRLCKSNCVRLLPQFVRGA